MNVSPATIEIILFYHYDASGNDFRDSPHFREASKKLVDIGMLKMVENGRRRFEPNREMMDIYVENLCSQPFPVLKYIIPKN